MNIRSLLNFFSLERTRSTETSKLDQAQAANVTSQGISAYTDSFEKAPTMADNSLSRNNYFSRQQLDAESLAGEQSYERNKTEETKSEYGGNFDPIKRYSGVIMQEGRVQLDADYNEDRPKKSDDDD